MEEEQASTNEVEKPEVEAKPESPAKGTAQPPVTPNQKTPQRGGQNNRGARVSPARGRGGAPNRGGGFRGGRGGGQQQQQQTPARNTQPRIDTNMRGGRGGPRGGRGGARGSPRGRGRGGW